ncbi:MAG TPA: hypothetical protein VHG90_04215 [Acidimicrobiales bacterium]|nr:hypothetical protein [Acidimicrobiales bacterium]
MTNFNIGSQQAGGTINQVGGDMVISGGQWNFGQVSSLEVAREMQKLAAALDDVDLPQTLRYATRQDVERVGRELTGRAPNRRLIADLARRIVTALDLAGALVTGSPIVKSLHALVSWLGTAGRSLASVLPV